MLLIHHVLLFVSSFLLPPPQHIPRWPSSCVVSSDILQPNQFHRLSVASRGSWEQDGNHTAKEENPNFRKEMADDLKRNIKPTFSTEHIRHQELLLAIVKWCKLIWFDHVTSTPLSIKTFFRVPWKLVDPIEQKKNCLVNVKKYASSQKNIWNESKWSRSLLRSVSLPLVFLMIILLQLDTN